MAPVKTRAIVLKVLPFRESSYILNIFTESHGLIHGIAKGIRAAKKNRQFIERGYLLELLVYTKPHRELHLLSSVQVLEYFPATRASLVRGAVRDVAIELILAAITVSDPHPEMFALCGKFLREIETKDESFVHPCVLWAFYSRFAAMMGFAIDFDKCMRCGEPLALADAYLNASQGGLACGKCREGRCEANMLHATVRGFLQGKVRGGEVRKALTEEDLRRTTRLLADFCRYHFDIRYESKALEFLEKTIE